MTRTTRRDVLTWALGLCTLPTASSCVWSAAPLQPPRAPTRRLRPSVTRAQDGELLVGTASIDITPDAYARLFLAGGGLDRRMHGVRDSIEVRAVYFDDGDRALAWVVVDLLGPSRATVERIRGALDGIELVLTGTGSFDGPDVIGAWGGSMLHTARASSGLDVHYLEYVEASILRAIASAAEAVVPCDLFVGRALVERSTRSSPVLLVEAKATKGAKPVASLLVVPTLPHFLGGRSRSVSAGVIGAVRDLMESDTKNALCLVLPGAPHPWPIERYADRRARDEALERAGRWLARAGREARGVARRSAHQTLMFAPKELSIPIEDPRFGGLLERRLIEPRGADEARIESELGLLILGDVAFALLPAWPSSSLAERLREQLARRAPDVAVVAGTNDQLGGASGEPGLESSGLFWPSPTLGARLEDALESLVREN